MEQLKKCPFCGGEAKIDKTTSNAVEVACSECSASTPLFWAFIGGKEKAIEAWNTRKPMERILEQLEELRMAEYDDSDEEPKYEDGEDIFDDGVSSGKFIAYRNAIEIIKEEMETNAD